jgi:hypothetical protein
MKPHPGVAFGVGVRIQSIGFGAAGAAECGVNLRWSHAKTGAAEDL